MERERSGRRAARGRPASSVRVPRDTESTSWASGPTVRARMQSQKTRDTAPELAVRRILHSRGLRYRVDCRPMPEFRSRADLVFRASKVAVFIDGCFWHGCPEHGRRQTKANSTYWRQKVARNAERDRRFDDALREAGWVPIRVWEHQDPADVADEIEATVRSRHNR